MSETLQSLFDDKRRGDIRDAIKSGRPIEFRKRLPDAEALESGIGSIRFSFSDEELVRGGYEKGMPEIPGYVQGMNFSGADRVLGGELTYTGKDGKCHKLGTTGVENDGAESSERKYDEYWKGDKP